MRKALRISTLAVLMAGLLAVFGCGSLPTGPDVSDVSTEVQSDGQTVSIGAGDVSPEASMPMRDLEVPDPAGSPDIVDVQPAPTVQGASRTVRINGLLGGIVAAGKFKVVFLPLTFSGQANVTVSQPDLSKLVVDLDITPASANRFRLPVLLIGDASSMPRELLSISTIQWWDPERNVWVNVPGASISLLNLTVQAPLWHFSKYRIEGRAGW